MIKGILKENFCGNILTQIDELWKLEVIVNYNALFDTREGEQQSHF
jgi:hypothetical protein